MRTLDVCFIHKAMSLTAIIGAGFLTGCASIVYDIHDPRMANDPVHSVLIKDPLPMQYGFYFSATKTRSTLIFIRRSDGCGNSLEIKGMAIFWELGHLEHSKWIENINTQGGWKDAHFRSRMNSSFHKPIELSLGNKQWWVVYSIVPVVDKSPTGSEYPYMIKVPLTWNHNLEFFNRNPSLVADMPALIWWLGTGSLQNCPWRYPATLYECEGAIYRVQTIKFWPDGRMTDLQVAVWTPTIEDVLDGISCLRVDRESASGESAVQLEKKLNNMTIEWKTKELPDIIAKADAAHLKDMVIKLEKAILSLDADSNIIKAAIDKAERFVPDPRDKTIEVPPAPARGEEIAKLIDQRKTLLANVLTLLKKALQSKG